MKYQVIDMADQMNILDQEIKLWEATHYQLTVRYQAALEAKADEHYIASIMREAEKSSAIIASLHKQMETLEKTGRS